MGASRSWSEWLIPPKPITKIERGGTPRLFVILHELAGPYRSRWPVFRQFAQLQQFLKQIFCAKCHLTFPINVV